MLCMHALMYAVCNCMHAYLYTVLKYMQEINS